MNKIDHKKTLKHLYRPSHKDFSTVDVPPMNFFMIDGKGDPNTSIQYQEALEAIYGLSYTIKFQLKKLNLYPDYTVMPLEGLWWSDDMDDFINCNKDLWCWTAMIMQPDHITPEMVNEAKQVLAKKKNPTALNKLRFESFTEGLSAQILYFGPYSDEGPTIHALHDFIHNSGYQRHRKHHEIYLSDFRRTKPEKLKTIIRQPMKAT